MNVFVLWSWYLFFIACGLATLGSALVCCQAQSQLQVKLSLKTELALFFFNPATHPPTLTPPGKVYFPTFFIES
jgi:hypothetical protein